MRADRDEAADVLRGKMTKMQANYRPSSDEGDEDWCGSCTYYEEKGKQVSPCEVVAGQVHDQDVCDEFEEDQEFAEDDEQAVPPEMEEEIVESLR